MNEDLAIDVEEMSQNNPPLERNAGQSNAGGNGQPNASVSGEGASNLGGRARLTGNSNSPRIPRRTFRSVAASTTSALRTGGRALLRASPALVVLDKELMQSVMSGDGYSLADMVYFGATRGLAGVAVGGYELYQNREELWNNRAAIYRDVVELAVPRLYNDIPMTWNNAFGNTTYDPEFGRQSHQEYGVSYRAGIVDGRFENAEQVRYRWSFAPFTDSERGNLSVYNQRYGLNMQGSNNSNQSGILRIYSPIAGRAAGVPENGDRVVDTQAGQVTTTSVGGERLESAYFVENGRVVAQVNEKPGGCIETYYYDASPQQASPLVRVTMSEAQLATTFEARNELEALWGKVETDALENIQIGNRTHVRRVTPLKVSPNELSSDYESFYYDENDNFVFHDMELAVVETEYFQQNGSQSSYERVLQGKDHSWSISREDLNAYLREKGMTQDEFETYVHEHQDLPDGLGARMGNYHVENYQHLQSTGTRAYATADSVELSATERTDVHPDERRLSRAELLERNTPRYAVLANPFLRREYATYCVSDTNYTTGERLLYDARGNLRQEEFYNTNRTTNMTGNQPMSAVHDYVRIGEDHTLKAVLCYDQNGMLERIQNPNSDEDYSLDCLHVRDDGRVVLTPPDGEKIYLSGYLKATTNENGQTSFQRSRSDYYQYRPEMQFECAEAFTSVNAGTIEPSTQLVRTFEVAKNNDVTQHHMYWSDGAVISGLTIDNSTGACGIYDPDGKLICVDTPLDENEARDTSWVNNHESARFQRVARSALNTQYDRLRDNDPNFHDTMAQWFMLSNQTIDSSSDPTMARLTMRLFFDRYKQEYPRQVVDLWNVSRNGFTLNMQEDIESSMQDITQQTISRMNEENSQRSTGNLARRLQESSDETITERDALSVVRENDDVLER